MQKDEGERIYLSPPNIKEEERTRVSKVLDSGWIAPVGSELEVFEAELEKIFKGHRVLAVNAGTSALHLALILTGISDGDEVVVGSFNFAACANVILYERAVPVFLDSEPETWNMDPNLLQEYLAKNKRPKAVIVTHLYGMPAKMESLRKICQSNEIPLIEDAAEALGSRLNDVPLGAYGDFGVLSFNGNKIITTGGGGALILKEELYERSLYLSTQANNGKYDYDHQEVGFNYRLSNVLAGIGVGQLPKLDFFVKRKRAIFESYRANLFPGVFDFPEEPSGFFSNRWLTTLLIKRDIDLEPIELIKYLDSKNIESRRLWKPLHLHTAYCKAPFHGSGISEEVHSRGLCLPSGTGLSQEDQDRIIDLINRFVASQ